MSSLCNMRYSSLERRLETQIQKMALALLFNMKFNNSIDFIELCNEIKNSCYPNTFLKKILFSICKTETSKVLFSTLLFDETPEVDWLALSKEKNLPVIIVDTFGVFLKWEDVIMNTQLPTCVVEKYQVMYDRAMINLLYQC